MPETMSEPLKEISPLRTEQAKKILQAEEVKNSQACAEEIKKVLDKYGYNLQIAQEIKIVKR